eukprot:288208-Pelagomonas_calceolata.AAC.5
MRTCQYGQHKGTGLCPTLVFQKPMMFLNFNVSIRGCKCLANASSTTESSTSVCRVFLPDEDSRLGTTDASPLHGVKSIGAADKKRMRTQDSDDHRKVEKRLDQACARFLPGQSAKDKQPAVKAAYLGWEEEIALSKVVVQKLQASFFRPTQDEDMAPTLPRATKVGTSASSYQRHGVVGRLAMQHSKMCA